MTASVIDLFRTLPAAPPPGDMREAALAWASRGFKVFPIVAGTKMPLVADFPAVATADPDQVRTLWSDPVLDWPLAHNVGVLTGGRLIVLDVDTKRGKPGLASHAALNLDVETLKVRTPSGGFHLYFDADREIANSADHPGPGLDIRGHHGYVLAPGSITETGTYTVDHDAPVAAAPAAFLARLAAPRERSDVIAPATDLDSDQAVERAREFLQSRAPAVEGAGGDDWTYRTACIVKDFGLSASMALDVMAEWNDGCSPPWDLDELAGKVENAFAYGLSAAGSQSPDVDFTGIGDLPAPRYVARKSRLRWLSDPEAQKQPDWLMRPWLPEIGVATIAGQSRAAKTFVALDLAQALAMAASFFDKKARERVGVLFVAAEAPGTIGPRLEALRLHKLGGADADMLPVTWADLDDVPRPPDLAARVATVVAAIEECIADAAIEMGRRYGLRLGAVIVDTVGAAFGVPDSDDEAAKLVVGALGVVSRKYGLLVLPVSHFGKDDRSGITGSYYWTAGADVVIAVTGNICERTGEVSDRRIAVTKNKLDEQGPISAFELLSVNLGLDRDGVEVSSAIVKATVEKPKAERPSPHADMYRECVTNAMIDKSVDIDGRPAAERRAVLALFRERKPGSKDSGNVSRAFASAERWAGVTVIHREGVDYVVEDQWPMMPRG